LQWYRCHCRRIRSIYGNYCLQKSVNNELVFPTVVWKSVNRRRLVELPAGVAKFRYSIPVLVENQNKIINRYITKNDV